VRFSAREVMVSKIVLWITFDKLIYFIFVAKISHFLLLFYPQQTARYISTLSSLTGISKETMIIQLTWVAFLGILLPYAVTARVLASSNKASEIQFPILHFGVCPREGFICLVIRFAPVFTGGGRSTNRLANTLKT